MQQSLEKNYLKFTSQKIKSEKQLKIIVNQLKKNSKTVGLCIGSYDLLHMGHMKHFESAKNYCDILIVGVTSDAYVKKRKGLNRPFVTENLRAYSIAQLESVDFVIISAYERGTDLITLLKPTYYIKGSDYINKNTLGITAERQAIISIGGEIKYTQDVKYSTTDLIRKIRKNNIQPICIISGGMAGIGKSTMLKTYSKKHNFVYINKDILNYCFSRTEDNILENIVTKNTNDFSGNGRKLQCYLAMLEFGQDNLSNGLPVVLDGYFSNKLNIPIIQKKIKELSNLYQVIKVYFYCSKSTLEKRIKKRNIKRDIKKLKDIEEYYKKHQDDDTTLFDITFNTDGDVEVNVDSFHHEIMKLVSGR